MSLISFPTNPDSIKNKGFVYGNQVVSGSTRKSEVSYTVPSNRNAVITLNFNAVMSDETNSSGITSTLYSRPMSITDIIKSGDLVYAGYVITFGASSEITLTWFYNLNGSTVHTRTENFAPTALNRFPAVCTTISYLEVDK